MPESIKVEYVCFNAARGFVGGASGLRNHVALGLRGFNAARGFVGGASSASSIRRVPRRGFNAARGFVGGARFNP